MQERSRKTSLSLLLSAGFIDYFGLGLVFPLFTFILFDPSGTLLPSGTSDAIRGLWLGILVAVAPAVLFFIAPIMGTLSDMKGRKKIISLCLAIGCLAYIIGVIAILYSSLPLLFLSRILYGISTGNLTVIQAGIVDLSRGNEKQANFGLYTMALGIGSTIGPFIGGVLAKPSLGGWINYSTPFAIAALLTAINWALILWKLPETHPVSSQQKINWHAGILHLKKAFHMKELRLLFLVMFLFFFGWNFFSKFIAVLLLKGFDFTQVGVGTFYAFKGMLFALCAGLLIRPVIKHFPPQRILEIAMVLGGIYFFFFLFVEQKWIVYLYHIPLVYIISLIFPVASMIVSDDSSPEAQGEILGIYGSVQSLALVLSPFGAGTLVTQYPYISVLIAGSAMLLSGIILYIYRLTDHRRGPKPLA